MAKLARLVAVVLAALGVGLSPASATPHVPPGVHSILIRSAIGTTKVTLPTEVRQIVKWFDALPPFRPLPCPYQLPTPANVSFAFRGAGGSTLLRATDHAPGMCGSSITYGNDGQVGYAPQADDGFVAKVSGLLYVDFDANAKRTAANKRVAAQDAARILRLLVLPPGSRRVTKPPSRELRSDMGEAWGNTSVHRHLMWKVHLPLDSVVRFESAHRPRGSRWYQTGSSTMNRITSKNLGFSFPPHAGLTSQALWIDMAPLKEGWTGLRASAEVVWVVARAASESVPPGVRTIEIRKTQQAPSSRSRLVHRVTAPGKVARIVHWFDALPLSPGGSYPGCTSPAFGWGPTETLEFLDGSGRELADASGAPYGGPSYVCDPIQFFVGGHHYPALLGASFLTRVERLVR